MNDVPLRFGSIAVRANPGSIVVAPDGTRTAAGVFPLSQDFGPASFTVTISEGSPHYAITLPGNTTLSSSSGATMRVDNFQSIPSQVGSANPPQRRDTVAVGATLRVGAGQAPGMYHGTFPVTVNLGN